MYTHALDPVLLTVAGVDIRYYGLVYVLGFIALYFYLSYLSRNDDISLDQEGVDDFVLYFLVGLLIGSRLFTFAFWNASDFLQNPLQLFYIWQGGMSYHGALFGSVIATYILSVKKGWNFWKLADIVSVPALFLLGLGRITNFINAELPGTVTSSSWCVTYPNHDIDGCRHPYQLYAAGKNIVLFLFFLPWTLTKKYKDGIIFLSTIIAYNTTRFFIDFWRDEPDILLNISMGQSLSILFTVVAVWFLVKIYKDNER